MRKAWKMKRHTHPCTPLDRGERRGLTDEGWNGVKSGEQAGKSKPRESKERCNSPLKRGGRGCVEGIVEL